MDRQQFIRAALGNSAAAVGGPFAFADLITPTQPTPVPSVVGHAEVRNAAQVFSGWENLYHGGMIRDAVVAQLRYCAELLNARCSERVRADLFSAVGLTGRALRDVAVHGHFVTEARHRLDTAIASYRDEYARARVLSQIELASLVMVTGDPGEAAMIGGQALDAAATIRSRRVADDIRALSRFGEPRKRLTEVAELTHRIGSAVVV